MRPEGPFPARPGSARRGPDPGGPGPGDQSGPGSGAPAAGRSAVPGRRSDGGRGDLPGPARHPGDPGRRHPGPGPDCHPSRRSGTGPQAPARAQVGPEASVQYLTARGELFRQLGASDDAIAAYRTLLTKIGPIPEVLVPLGELVAGGGSPEAVAELRGQLVATTSPALAARHHLEAIEAYLQRDPVATLQRLGWCQAYFRGRDLFQWMELDTGARAGDLDRVRGAVAAMQRTPGLAGAPLQRAADPLAERAAAWVDSGDPAKAGALAGLADEIQPGRPASRLVPARTALIANRLDEAQAQAKALLADPGARPGALEVLGRVALARNQSKEARDWFDQLAAALPEASMGPYWQGISAYRAGDYAAALPLLRTAYGRNPDPRIESALGACRT